MRILFAASEAVPLIKTGGLADVAGSLPAALRMLDMDVRLILPAYPAAVEQLPDLEVLGKLRVPPGHEEVRLLAGRLQPHGLPVILVEHAGYFDRPGNPYAAPDGSDWPDNPDRFALFCRVITMIATGRAGMEWRPDLVHCNDWQTGLVPPLVAGERMRPRTVFTIHNLAYQGVFGKDIFERLGLSWDLWRMDALEYHGNFAFIKGGIAFADLLTTVSPTYAREILTPLGGHGLDSTLLRHADRLHGILNGIDYHVWNPAEDAFIPQHYDHRSFQLKARNKAELQRKTGLEVNPDAILFGHIGRMVYQKGVDLISDIVPRLMEEDDTQLVILGSGERGLERAVRNEATRFAGRMSVTIAYDEPLSHLIEAGADAFLMPSRFEPCGLNQMYSLRYGTVPVVHRVGGLADSVVDATPAHILTETATGFVFSQASAEGLWEAVSRAIGYYRRPGIWWEKLAVQGMQQDFSWNSSARHYLGCYREASGEEEGARGKSAP